MPSGLPTPVTSATRPASGGDSSVELGISTAPSVVPGERLERRLEHRCVPVDLRLGGARAHQRHVVERSEQDATVERMEMQEAFELRIRRAQGLASVPRGGRRAPILGTAAELHDVPGQLDAVYHPGDSLDETGGELLGPLPGA